MTAAVKQQSWPNGSGELPALGGVQLLPALQRPIEKSYASLHQSPLGNSTGSLLGRQQMSGEEEFYPMPAFATLEAADPDASAKFYAEILGFRVVFAMPGADGRTALVHLRRAKYADLLIRRSAETVAAKGAGLRLCYSVPLEEIDAVFRQVEAAGADVLEPIGNRPWNARDFTVADPDGFRINLTAGPVDAGRSFTDVVEKAGNPKSA